MKKLLIITTIVLATFNVDAQIKLDAEVKSKATNYELSGEGKLIETKIETKEHEPEKLLLELQTIRDRVIDQRDSDLAAKNEEIAEIETKIEEIENLLK